MHKGVFKQINQNRSKQLSLLGNTTKRTTGQKNVLDVEEKVSVITL